MSQLQKFAQRAFLSQGELLALILLPVVLALLMPSWTFLAPLSWIDPYLYTGYFLDLSKYMEVFGPTYYGSRLPWLLLGSGLNSVFNFEVANLILRFTLYYGGVISIYFAVRLTWRDRLAAFLTAAMMGVTSPFLSAVSWDNPDGAATSWMCVTLGLATAAATTQNPRYSRAFVLAAGFMTMMFVSTQIYTLVFAPLPVLWYLVLDRTRHKHDLVYALLFFAFGAIAGFGLAGALSTHVGGNFNYLQPQIDAVRSLRGQDYYKGGLSWVKDAGWLTIPALGVLVSLGLLARSLLAIAKQRGRFWLTPAEHLTMACAALMPIGIALFYIYRLWALRTPEIQTWYYTSYFVPYVFLSMGAALTLIVSRVSTRTKLILGIGGVIVLLAPFASGLLRPSEQCLNQTCSIGEEGLMLVAVAALLVAALSMRRIEPAIAGFLVFAVLNIGASDARFVRFKNNESLYEMFLQVERVNDKISPYDKDGRLFFWLTASDDPNAGVAAGVSSLHLYGYRLIARDFPEVGQVHGYPKHKFLTGERIAIISSRPNVAEDAVETIKREGFNSRVLGTFTDTSTRQPVNVAIVQVELPTDVRPGIEIDVASLAAIPGATVTRGQSGVSVTTGKTRYAYSALLPVGPKVLPEYSGKGGFVRVEGTGGDGFSGLGVLKSDRSGWTTVVQIPAKKGKPFDLYLPITSWDDTSDLIVMNWDRGGVSSATIGKVTVYVKEAPGAP